MKQICEDLAKEHEILDAFVADLDEAGWNTMTPAEGWSIKDQICHLAYFDERARISAMDPEAFAAHLKEMTGDMNAFMSKYKEMSDRLAPAEALEWWRTERKAFVQTFRALDPKTRLPWYGPPMSAKSSATARLMETWAHGQDIVDALGKERPVNDGLRNIAHLGVITFGWSYANRGRQVPDVPVRVELTAPSGEIWTWGPEDARERVSGPAVDFCLVVTQRRNVADTRIQTVGETAAEWMSIAQCFAGPPTMGPAPGTVRKAT